MFRFSTGRIAEIQMGFDTEQLSGRHLGNAKIMADKSREFSPLKARLNGTMLG